MQDSFGRRIAYLRISVTDRCDFRCSYCLPPGYKGFRMPEEWLRPAEIERLARIFVDLGVTRIRLTGGEPLVRPGIVDIAARLGRLPGLEDLSLSTNASRLAGMAGELRAAGVSRVNVSLDSLDPARFREITQGDLQRVLDGLMAARAAGFSPIKINTLVMAGVNEDEAADILAFCREHGFTLRFIETMPMGDSGRAGSGRYVALERVLARLREVHELVPASLPGGGPARYYRLTDSDLHIGLITPMSQHFCETCNRVRLSATGTLYLCLGQEDKLELGTLLRAGASDAELRAAILAAVARKPERHEFLLHPGRIGRVMAATGG